MSTLAQARPGDEVTVSGFDGHITAIERYRSPALNLDVWHIEYGAGAGPPMVLLLDDEVYVAPGPDEAESGSAAIEQQQAEPAVRGSAQFERVDRKGRSFGRRRFAFHRDETAVEIIFEQGGMQIRVYGRRLAEGALEHFPA